MQELFGLLSFNISSSPHLTGPVIFFGMTLGLPALIGLVVTLGDWKAVGKSFLIWYGILFAVFSLGASRVSDTMHGVLLYGMFFSIGAVPVIAVLLLLWRWLKSRVWPFASTA